MSNPSASRPSPTQESGDFYVKAAKSRAANRCCGTPDAVSASGYDEAALANAPEEAVQASFGCGDPVAFTRMGPGETVIDLGCGAGLDLIMAAERVGPEGRVIGIDASADMLALARKNVLRAGLADQVQLLEGTIEALPVGNQVADWVISNCVINLATDKAAVFQEIRRVLKPGGQAVISDLVADDLPDWVSAHQDLYSACISGAVPEHTYLALARDAGLQSPEVIGRLVYDEALVRGLITDALPLPLDEIASRLAITRQELIDMAGRDLAGCITSIKLRIARDRA
ncbi:MAG: methyltransferase domain-containing protein [Oceanicaulis sp.]|nr:methyltransferase domain-containing protein [Oceanicaulis sp.]